MYKISVIVCAHNPRLDYLERVLDALKKQTFPVKEWELLLIDNSSTIPLSQSINLSWHVHSRIVIENKLGVSYARIRGINEAVGEVLVFVDDDTCLKDDYLQIVTEKFQENDLLGVIGAGKVALDFECQPSANVSPFIYLLSVRNDTRSNYSNQVNFSNALPWGAGMSILKHIASEYANSYQNRNSSIAAIGRVGSLLMSCEDVDIALYACSLGYLSGAIPELELIHIIPKSRLEISHLLKLAAGNAFSHYILGKLWNYMPDHPENAILKRLRYLNKWRNLKGLSRKIFIAEYRAVEEARTLWSKTSA